MCCPCLNERLTSPFHYPSSVPLHTLTYTPPFSTGKDTRERDRTTETSFPSFSRTPNFFTSPRCNQTRPLSHEAITSGVRLSLPSRSSHPSLQYRSRNNNHYRHRSPQSSFWVSLQVSRDRFISLDILFSGNNTSPHAPCRACLPRCHFAPLIAVANMSPNPQIRQPLPRGLRPSSTTPRKSWKITRQ